VSFSPAASDIFEDWQDGNLIIVIPKNQRIPPEKDQAEKNNRYCRDRCAK